jgi:uncharacterized membrane protein
MEALRRQTPARRVAVAGVVGALYVVLSLAVAPFAFGPLQFRVGEALKPLVIKYPATIPAFGIGTVIINFFSPFAGVLELAFMPLVDVVGGRPLLVRRPEGGRGVRDLPRLPPLRHFHRRRRRGGANLVAGLPYLVSFASVAASEIILLLTGNALLVRRV